MRRRFCLVLGLLEGEFLPKAASPTQHWLFEYHTHISNATASLINRAECLLTPCGITLRVYASDLDLVQWSSCWQDSLSGYMSQAFCRVIMLIYLELAASNFWAKIRSLARPSTIITFFTGMPMP